MRDVRPKGPDSSFRACRRHRFGAASELSSLAGSDDHLAWYVANAARLLGEAHDSLGQALPPSAAMARVTSSGGAGGGAMG